VLKNPPLNTKNQQTKDAAFQLVMRVIKSFQNSAEIDNAIKQLDVDGIDTLMKYIYKGFEREPKDSPSLLAWHEKVFFLN
jgi:actin related protein 2/3 complex subunit 5